MHDTTSSHGSALTVKDTPLAVSLLTLGATPFEGVPFAKKVSVLRRGQRQNEFHYYFGPSALDLPDLVRTYDASGPGSEGDVKRPDHVFRAKLDALVATGNPAAKELQDLLPAFLMTNFRGWAENRKELMRVLQAEGVQSVLYIEKRDGEGFVLLSEAQWAAMSDAEKAQALS